MANFTRRLGVVFSRGVYSFGGCACVVMMAAAGSAVAAPFATSDGAMTPDSEKLWDQGEYPRDPADSIVGPRLNSPAWNWTPIGPGLERQVNVNAQGQNIVGDAANEPSIVVDPTARNRIAVGWRQFDSITSNFREAGYSFSRDGGRTWTAGVIENGIFRSDPILEADSNGRLFYLSLATSPSFLNQMFRSDNGGATWPVKTEAFGGDKAWFVIDKTGGPGNNFQHQSWSTGAGCCGTRIYTRSTDGGATWLNPIALPQNAVFGTQAVGNNGELYIAGINSPTASNSNFRVLRSTNANNGAVTPTFTSATVNMGGALIANSASSPNPGGLLGQVWVDVDRSNGPRRGWIYVLASVDPAGADPLDVVIVRSTDGGVTWSTPVKVNDDNSTANWQWFGTLGVAPNGRLDVVWNDTRGGAVTSSRLFYSFSNDGGTTWSANQALTPAFNSTVGWPNQNKIGDYYDIESDSVGAFVVYSATFNGEQDVFVRRIGDYDCNGNGIGDAAEIAAGGARDCNSNGIPDRCEIAAGTLRSADFNRDDTVDFFDYLDFVAAFSTGAAEADFNGDGTVDFFDYLDFVAAFDVGC